MFKVDLMSVHYDGADIGNDLVFESTIDHHTKTLRADLRPGRTFNPPAGTGKLYSSSAIPAPAGTTVDLLFRVKEKDVLRDDKGSAKCTFTIPKYSVEDQTGGCVVSVKESSKTANYRFTYKVTYTRPLFEKLWNNHPANKGILKPCATNGKGNFDNQCAIRVGTSLLDSGIGLGSFKGTYCWHGHGKRHVLRTQELANWLAGQPHLFGPLVKIQSIAQVEGKMGILFFKDFWGRGNQGDHIDIWDGEEMPKESGADSYFSRAKEVWFWRL